MLYSIKTKRDFLHIVDQFQNVSGTVIKFSHFVIGCATSGWSCFLIFDHWHQWSSHHWTYMKAKRYYAKNSSMKQSVQLIGINMFYCNCKITILGCNRMYHKIFDKLNSDMCSYVIFILCRFWMSNFSHDASGKYCICEATVGSAQ